jgi:hypothetical protein
LAGRDTVFKSFLQAGFECSTHKRRNGERLELLRSTGHERLAAQDYRRLRAFGIRTVRTAASWHRIEGTPGEYCFDSLETLVAAADEVGIELIIDLLHFGWPDWLDVFSKSWVNSFERFTHELTRYFKHRRGGCRWFAPINEISFLAWGGGDVASLNPYAMERGSELKRNLIRGAARASKVLLEEMPSVRLLAPEPVIHIIGDPSISGDDEEAERFRLAQYEAWDMLSGQSAPELGGRPEYLDILGANFYDRNQWVHRSKTPLRPGEARYRPFRHLLEEVWRRYGKPLLVSETGAEGDRRAEWFRYVYGEVAEAHKMGVPVEGICLYPILNHAGWEDDRYCPNGLFDYADENGNRAVYEPLARAILDVQSSYSDGGLETDLKQDVKQYDLQRCRSDLFLSPAMELRVPAPAASHEPDSAKSKSVFL